MTPESLAEGKRVFEVHCTGCHGLAGGGGTGPDLTDSDTLHGERYADMLRVVMYGVESTGMPSWVRKIGAGQVAHVSAYIFSLKGTNNPKPGEKKSPIRFSRIVFRPGADFSTR